MREKDLPLARGLLSVSVLFLRRNNCRICGSFLGHLTKSLPKTVGLVLSHPVVCDGSDVRCTGVRAWVLKTWVHGPVGAPLALRLVRRAGGRRGGQRSGACDAAAEPPVMCRGCAEPPGMSGTTARVACQLWA